MSTYQSAPQLKSGLTATTGILVVNLGTPDAPTAASVRRFLRQFLSDPRVIEYPRFLWWLVLNLVILQIRPSRSAAAYRKIWTDNGSPLMLHSVEIVSSLQARLDTTEHGPFRVELAVNYGRPSIDDAVDRLLANGARRIITLPLYPQYSGTTTASVIDAVARKFSKLRWIPEARFINDYHTAPGYIAALADSVRDAWATKGRGNKLLMSFHGIPNKTVQNGDPYLDQCRKTAQLLAHALDLANDDWVLTFQSRVGREEWLSPYTDQKLEAFGEQGLSKIDVVCPGFPADCLETLEEIALQNAALFVRSGGGTLHYIPALNARDDHIRFLTNLVIEHTAGWNTDSNNDARDALLAHATGTTS
jgi:ferrochelatase